MPQFLTIAELGRRTGVTTSALRYYDELGLVRPTRRVSGHRRYTVDAVTSVAVVKFFQEAGFTLAETKRLMESRQRAPVAWRALAARKAEELRHRIEKEEAALHAIEHGLVCRKANLFDCPTFWATIESVLAGLELADAHSRAHASTDSAPRLSRL